MKRTPVLVLFVVITMSGVGVAHSRECAGVSVPDQSQVESSTLVLNGLGLRQATILKVNVYVAALYTAKATSDPNAILGSNTPKQLFLHFVRDVGAADLNKAWDEGFEANAKGQLPALKPRVETLKSSMADMKTGEQVTFTHKPGAGIQVDVGGAAKGTIEGDDFARAFLSIWLGTKPPNAALKAGLLGGPCP
jgi:Chalcone isomerase-like